MCSTLGAEKIIGRSRGSAIVLLLQDSLPLLLRHLITADRDRRTSFGWLPFSPVPGVFCRLGRGDAGILGRVEEEEVAIFADSRAFHEPYAHVHQFASHMRQPFPTSSRIASASFRSDFGPEIVPKQPLIDP